MSINNPDQPLVVHGRKRGRSMTPPTTVIDIPASLHQTEASTRSDSLYDQSPPAVQSSTSSAQFTTQYEHLQQVVDQHSPSPPLQRQQPITPHHHDHGESPPSSSSSGSSQWTLVPRRPQKIVHGELEPYRPPRSGEIKQIDYVSRSNHRYKMTIRFPCIIHWPEYFNTWPEKQQAEFMEFTCRLPNKCMKPIP